MNRKGRGWYAGSRYGPVSQGQPYVSRLHANTIQILLMSFFCSVREAEPPLVTCMADMCRGDHAASLF